MLVFALELSAARVGHLVVKSNHEPQNPNEFTCPIRIVVKTIGETTATKTNVLFTNYVQISICNNNIRDLDVVWESLFFFCWF